MFSLIQDSLPRLGIRCCFFGCLGEMGGRIEECIYFSFADRVTCLILIDTVRDSRCLNRTRNPRRTMIE